MRALILALALCVALPAAAQSASTGDIAHVSRLLGAIWRPLPANSTGTPTAIFESACEGAIEELEVLAGTLPAETTPQAVMGLRTTRGLVFIAGADPGQMFVFPSPALTAITGGAGSFTVTDRAQGRLDFRDGAGAVQHLQVGVAAGKTMLRLLRPDGAAQTFVGCASTAN